MISRRYRTSRVSISTCAGVMVLVCNVWPAVADSVVPTLPVAETEIRLAVSVDGRAFVDTGRVFARHAAAPDIVMLRDGGLLALYDFVDKATGQIRMVVSASPNDGKRWTAPRPVVVQDEHGEPLAALLLPDLGHVHQVRARCEASRRATRLALVLHRWADRRGRFPSSLAELGLPRDDSLQIDPFTGEPFRYLVEKDDFTLYSAGENGLDDGGAPATNDDHATADQSDDIVFWPPQSEG